MRILSAPSKLQRTDMEINRPKRRNGRNVALALILICIAGFLATVWNYSRTHPFANDATLLSASLVEASFPKEANLKKAQRAVISISGKEIRGGTILEVSDSGKALIQMDAEVSAKAGTKVHVNIDGTVGPQHTK